MRGLTRYNEVKEFIEREHRNPSKHRIEEHDMLNWVKANRKLLNAGTLKEERVEAFKELLALIEHITALEVALLYKNRWSVELFFKWVKQHLKIKKFWGDSENAVRGCNTSPRISSLYEEILSPPRRILTAIKYTLDKINAA